MDLCTGWGLHMARTHLQATAAAHNDVRMGRRGDPPDRGGVEWGNHYGLTLSGVDRLRLGQHIAHTAQKAIAVLAIAYTPTTSLVQHACL